MRKILQVNQKEPARQPALAKAKLLLAGNATPARNAVSTAGWHSDAGGEKILRKVASEVRLSDIKTTKFKKILKEMSQALKSQKDGVAIAAPQIGYSFRIFIVTGKIFAKDFAKKQEDEQLDQSDSAQTDLPLKDLIFINPKISKLSRDKEWVPEGCLSVRPLYGKTYRSKKATVTAYDENGKKFVRGASGLLAQIFQHETDHLNGILFIDHAKDVKEEKVNYEE